MASVARVLYFFFLFLMTIAEGGKKKSMDKIVIHVPYKIIKHHHTHTKYKVITIPAPKHENTVIYLKEEIQPIKPIPQVQPQQKNPEPIIPPHQQSAQGLLESLASHKEEESNQEQQYSTITEEQKSVETQNTENFTPNLQFKPMILPHANMIPNFAFKPFIIPQQPNLFINPMHGNFIPKLTYQPMFHLPQGHYKPMSAVQDNIHTSSQIYKTIIPPGPKTTYKVREKNQEDHRQPKHHKIPVPSLKTNKKEKKIILQPRFKSARSLMLSDPEYEYEHVGYLIIDGNTKKVVGKNFKEGLNLSK